MADTHPPLASHPLADDAVEAFLAGLAAADPTVAVRQAVRAGLLDDWLEDRERPKQVHVLALGKAAPRMLWGLVETSVPFKGLGVTTPGQKAPHVDTFHWMSGDHPIPGPASFAAGRAVTEWLEALPREAPLLVLLSGGASSALEVAAPGVSEGRLRKEWAAWMREGVPIAELNKRRSTLSAIKNGGLARLAHKKTSRIRVWVVADTPPDSAAATVGSGPFHAPDLGIEHRVLLTNDDLVAAAGLRLAAKGYSVYRHAARIDGEAESEAASFVAAFQNLDEPSAALVGGGEATVQLGEGHPMGGRCHHAALAAASHLRAGEIFLAAASDGADGDTREAGAWSLAGDVDPLALARRAAHETLHLLGRTVRTGATGTNVNDVWIALRK